MHDATSNKMGPGSIFLRRASCPVCMGPSRAYTFVVKNCAGGEVLVGVSTGRPLPTSGLTECDISPGQKFCRKWNILRENFWSTAPTLGLMPLMPLLAQCLNLASVVHLQHGASTLGLMPLLAQCLNLASVVHLRYVDDTPGVQSPEITIQCDVCVCVCNEVQFHWSVPEKSSTQTLTKLSDLFIEVNQAY